jgi:hypothetical protein
MKALETEFQGFCTLVRKEATVLHKFLAAQHQNKFSVSHGNSTFHGCILKNLPLVLTLPMYPVHIAPSITSKSTLVLSSHPHQGLPRYLPRKIMPSCPRRQQPFCLQVFEYFSMYFSPHPCVVHTPSSPSFLICQPTTAWSEYKVCN